MIANFLCFSSRSSWLVEVYWLILAACGRMMHLYKFWSAPFCFTWEGEIASPSSPSLHIIPRGLGLDGFFLLSKRIDFSTTQAFAVLGGVLLVWHSFPKVQWICSEMPVSLQPV